ncbi:hypothetical protein TNCV_924021 [Trichonephila clavipes]|nr:hypothetical protein TNCV_924021 [Trichonephila clavipes]
MRSKNAAHATGWLRQKCDLLQAEQTITQDTHGSKEKEQKEQIFISFHLLEYGFSLLADVQQSNGGYELFAIAIYVRTSHNKIMNIQGIGREM